MFKAITFDLWNTIFDVIDYTDERINILAQILKNNGFTRDKKLIKKAYLSALEYFIDSWRNEQRHISAEKRTDYMMRSLGIDVPDTLTKIIVKKFEEIVFSNPPPLIDGAPEIILALHKNYKLGLICDSGISPGRILRYILRTHGILKYFSCTIFSDEVGYTKPHPVVFKKALEQLHAEPAEALHIGDLLRTDIAGAQAVGMTAVWFNWRREPRGQHDIVPDYEIHALSELLAILA
jgi:putative hydrolase of the HAD superfamily